jgi:predicted metallopeptidase
MVETTYGDGEAEDIKKIAKGLLEEYDTFAKVRLDEIYFLRSSCSKARTFFARIMRPDALFRHFTHLPLIIEVNSDAFDELDAKMRKVVVYHELYHIEVMEGGGYKLRRHDVQEFSNVLETFGESVSLNLHDTQQKYKEKMEAKAGA